jgi:hypothetical protein
MMGMECCELRATRVPSKEKSKVRAARNKLGKNTSGVKGILHIWYQQIIHNTTCCALKDVWSM